MNLLPLGVDPGLKGGCALVFENYVLHYAQVASKKVRRVKVESGIPVKGKARQPDNPLDISVYDSAATIAALRTCRLIAAQKGFNGIAMFLEEPQSMQNRDSHASYISMGRCMQNWENAASYFGIPIYIVNPKHWKSCMGLSSNKEESLALAAKLFPTLPNEIRKNNDICEAALLAAWAQDHRPDCLISRYQDE